MRKLAIGTMLFLATCSSSGGNGDGGHDAWDAGGDRPCFGADLTHLDADLLEIDREAIVDCQY